MIRLIAVGHCLGCRNICASHVTHPHSQPDNMITQVREACGAGMHMVNGRCVTTSARRHVRRDVIRRR